VLERSIDTRVPLIRLTPLPSDLSLYSSVCTQPLWFCGKHVCTGFKPLDYNSIRLAHAALHPIQLTDVNTIIPDD
jgi:hypothetical protein